MSRPMPPTAYGTITMPMLPACATTLFTMASSEVPASLLSLCLIFAISHTCFKLTWPTAPSPALPGGAPPECVALPFPSNPVVDLGPATLPAPFSLFFVGCTPAALSRSDAVGGVRRSKVKERSGRTVTRAGTGVPVM